MDTDKTKLLATADEKALTWMKAATLLDTLTLLKHIRIALPHQSSQLHELELDIIKELRRPAQRRLLQ